VKSLCCSSEDRAEKFLSTIDHLGIARQPFASMFLHHLTTLRPNYSGPLIVNAGITPERAADLVADGKADAVAFGRMFLANPDLPVRIRRNGPFNELRRVGHYGGGAIGYTDYPTLKENGAA
jgi:2,4-dienoyl-CoA reductase-like NADH-dependent reductase (Old Yellow Enzyme family)